MHYTRIAALAAAGLSVASLSTLPAGAREEQAGPQVAVPTLDVGPTSGPVGTEVTISGEDCAFAPDDAGAGATTTLPDGGLPTADGDVPFVEVYFINTDTSETLVTEEADPDLSGDWTGMVTVPDVDPDGNYGVTATCFLAEITAAGGARSVQQVPEFDYEIVPFDVTAPEPTPEVPPAATPVVAAPELTG